ncbi:glycosyltransferase family 2 protein [Candidatus Margulisiibacteriota bacterium]
MTKITCIIPAYNEENRILPVLEVIKQSPLISEIIIVNDGSTDNTKNVLSGVSGIKLINHETNMGKGDAMQTGIDASTGDLILFLDADLKGLTTKHIEELITSVANGSTDMSFSYRDNSGEPFFKVDIFSGERALMKETLKKIGSLKGLKYAVEAYINKYLIDNNLKWKSIRCEGLYFMQKEEKKGSKILGALGLYKMYWDISRKVPGLIKMWWRMGRQKS